MSSYQLGIIGAGNMAEAVVRGVLSAKLLEPAHIIAADPTTVRRDLFRQELGITSVEHAAEFVGACDAILLSVKPQQMAEALATLAGQLSPQTLLISIAAGISTAWIGTQLGGAGTWRIIRAMPNLPMLIGKGMVALARGQHAKEGDLERAELLFTSSATVIEVDESQIDAVTAVSGSGPAYVFYLAEQMIRAAGELGLSPDQARVLTSQTILGAARMLDSSDESPEALRQKVTSPGGTTAAAIASMESRQWAQITVDAIKAAESRARELGK